MDPRDPGKPAWLPPKGDDHVGGRGLLHIAWPKEWQHEVDCDWPAGEPPGGSELLGDRCASATDRPKTAGLRYGRSKLMAGHSAHPGLDNRRWQTTQVDHRAVTPRPAYPVAARAGQSLTWTRRHSLR